MTCEKYQDLMMGCLDGELDQAQEKAFREHLESCPACQAEFEQLSRIQRITDDMSLPTPEDRLIDHYWHNIYRRIERGAGWILLSVAAILLLMFGGFKLIEGLIRSESLGLGLKIGLLMLVAALAVLLVSIVRERLYFRGHERYKDVRR